MQFQKSNLYIDLLSKTGVLLFVLYVIWSLSRPTESGAPWSFMDYANLVFHEAGHLIFSFSGDYIRILGGTLMQLLVPIIVGVVFMQQKRLFSVAFALFWLGESLNNVSYYMADAKERALPLLGGMDASHHDWYNLLLPLNLLDFSPGIGLAFRIIAWITITGAFVWMAGDIFITGRRIKKVEDEFPAPGRIQS